MTFEEMFSAIENLDNKLQHAGHSLESIQKLTENEKYLTVKDVAKLLGTTESSARRYMSRPDFPRLEVGKGLKVSATAFYLYNLSKRDSSNEWG